MSAGEGCQQGGYGFSRGGGFHDGADHGTAGGASLGNEVHVLGCDSPNADYRNAHGFHNFAEPFRPDLFVRDFSLGGGAENGAAANIIGAVPLMRVRECRVVG